MTALLQRLTTFRKDQRAVTALEYGLIAASVVAIGLAGFSVIGDTLNSKVTNIESVLSSDG